MTTTQKIYIYNENCTMKGRICHGNSHYEDLADFGDVSLFGEGTDEELIAQALDELANRYDFRSGGARDSFRWRCAREVLRYLDGPKVEYSEEERVYLPVVEEVEEAE